MGGYQESHTCIVWAKRLRSAPTMHRRMGQLCCSRWAVNCATHVRVGHISYKSDASLAGTAYAIIGARI
jgi:hypothetical protein